MANSKNSVITVSQAAVKIYDDAGHNAVQSVLRLIHRKVFPGARKLEPDKLTSPYLIPEAEVDAYLATEIKHGQATKA